MLAGGQITGVRSAIVNENENEQPSQVVVLAKQPKKGNEVIPVNLNLSILCIPVNL